MPRFEDLTPPSRDAFEGQMPPVPPRRRRVEVEVVEEEMMIEPQEELNEVDIINRVSGWRRLGRFCLFALAFLTPIIAFPLTSIAIDASKTAVLGILLLVSFIAFIGAFISERKVSYSRSLLFGAMLLFVVIVGASTFFSISRNLSLYGNLTLPDSLLSVAIYLLTLVLSASFFERRDISKIGWLLWGSITLGTLINLLSIFGVNLPFGLGVNGLNPFGSLTAWGVLMAGALLVTMEVRFSSLRNSQKIFLGIPAILMFFGLLILNYQFLWVALAFLMILVAALRFVAHSKFGSSLALVVIALFLALISTRLPVIKQVPSEVRPSFGVTMTVAKAVLAGPRIALGSGPSTFAYDWGSFRPQEINNSVLWGVRFGQGFGFYETLLVTSGLIGLLSFLLIVYAFGREVFRNLEDRAVSAIGIGGFFLLVSFFFFPGFISGLFLLSLGGGIVLAASGKRKEVVMQELSPRKLFGLFIGAIVLLAGSLAALYFFSSKYLAVAFESQALSALAAGDVNQGLQKIGSAVALDETPEYLRVGSQALFAQTQQMINSGALNSQDAAVRNRVQALAANAVKTAQRAVALDEKDASSWMNLGQIYEALAPYVGGADAFAETIYRKVSELEPKNPEPFLSLGRLLIASSDRVDAKDEKAKRLQAAVSVLEAAIALKPDYAAAHFLLAQLYIRAGDAQKAIQKLNDTRATNPFDAGLAFQVGLLYYQTGQMEPAQREFESALSLSSDFANASYFLGLTLDARGSKPQALEQFQKLLVTNPDNTEIKRIIKNLEEGRGALQDISPPEKPPEKRSTPPVSEKKTNSQ